MSIRQMASVQSTAAWLAFLVVPALLGGPFIYTLAVGYWSVPESNDSWLVLLLVIWLLYRRRGELDLHQRPVACSKAVMLAALWGILLPIYVIGRSQSIAAIEGICVLALIAVQIWAIGGSKLLAALRMELFILVFIIPAPASVVQLLTSPLKLAVSIVATEFLGSLGYPIAQSGVMLFVGPYQLLVADACSGLNSIFTLEALGLIYVKLQGYQNKLYSASLAVLIIPISFLANVIRVMALVLVTYHLGDQAGQGFLHVFAGMTLFLVGLGLMLIASSVLTRIFAARST